MSAQSASLRDVLAHHTAAADEALIEPLDERVVRCYACGHRCRVKPGRHGVCHVRFNEEGELRVPFGYVSSLAADPIEKKPFYHAYPGEEALSFGMLGCDFHCSFCQNWITSQTLRDDKAVAKPHVVSPDEIVRIARQQGCRVLTSTYNEPLITAEWAAAVFREGREHGMVGSLVSNGHGTPEVLEFLRPHVDLFNIDLKAFSDKTYRQLGGVLENVLATIRKAHAMGYWVEVVTLVVPGMNDSDTELGEIAEFIAGVSPDIPWHVTAFHPTYKLNTSGRTTADTLLRAVELGAKAGLRFVYPGNCPGGVGDAEHTKCPDCGAVVIERSGFRVLANRVSAGACPDCGARIPGVMPPRD